MYIFRYVPLKVNIVYVQFLAWVYYVPSLGASFESCQVRIIDTSAQQLDIILMSEIWHLLHQLIGSLCMFILHT